MPELTDAHCHLQDPAFDADLPEVLARSRDAGVTSWVVNGTRPSDWARVAALAEKVEGVLPQFGLHPWHADEPSGWQDELPRWLERFPQAGIGEIGLDSRLTPIPLGTQLAAFRLQIELARSLQRPCTLHAVGTLDLLRTELKRLSPTTFLLHGFGGSPSIARPFLELGAHFSLGGRVLRASWDPSLLESIPADRLHMESDAPWQHPLGRNHRSEPALVRLIADRLSTP